MADDTRVGASVRTLGEAPGSRSVARWRGATDDGAPVDVVRPLTDGSAAPGAIRAAFARAHRAVSEAKDPALVAVHEVIEEPTSVAVVRAPLDEATLADVRGPLPGDLIAAIGARLFPAVLEVGGALGGTVLPHDVGLDADGWVVLAPLGPHTSHVERSVAGAAAPESFEGAAPDGRAALYGLGALLYRLATNRVPPTGAPPTAPSSWNHRVPPELDRAILRLLDPDPDARPGALPDLQAAAGKPEDLRPLARDTSSPTASRAPAVLTLRNTTGRPLVVPHDALAGLAPREKSALAGLAGVPLAAVESLIRANLPLVVARETSQQALDSHRRAVQDAVSVDALVPREPRLGPVGWAALTAVGAGVPAALSLLLIPLINWLAVIPGALVGSAVGAVGLWRMVVAAGAGRAAADAEKAWAIQEKGHEVRSQWPSVVAVDQRIARLRQDLARADLPVAADADVRDALKAIEGRLDAMITVLQTAERALGAVDRDRLGTRLQTLERSQDPAHADAREQVARTAADLADVEARRDRQLDAIHQIEAALDELASALVEQDTAGAGDELDRVQRTARLLRARQGETS